MTLYFVYGNRQLKKLAESNFADDLYDVIIGFFEDHGSFPHILSLRKSEENAIIEMVSTTEHFLITDINDENYHILSEMVDSYSK